MSRSDDFNKKFKAFCDAHNRRPVSRRDFLSAGLIGFSGMMFMPTLGSLLLGSQSANAADECVKPDPNSMPMPFITLNLSGGAALAANFVPHDVGGQLLTSYDLMGLGAGGALPIVREFGNVPFAGNGISKLLQGIQETSTPDTRSKTAFVGVCVRSRDDSGANMFDATGMVAKAGLAGDRLPNMGRRDTPTGVNQQHAYVKPPSPLIVRSINDVTGALGAAGTLGQMSQNQRVSLYRLIQNLSASQKASLDQFSGGRNLASLVGCATGQNVEIASITDPGVDVRSNAQLAPVWGVNAQTGAGDERVVFGSMVLSVLTGKSGAVGLDKGGYDYHDNTRTTGDNQDLEAGRHIGRIIQSAAALGKSVFLYVTSDGSVSSAKSNDVAAPWNSDRGEAGCAYMICFNPAGRPATNNFQLGQFTQGQVADDKFVSGGSAQMAAAAVFANYLKVSNKLDLLGKVIPNILSMDDLNKILKFG